MNMPMLSLKEVANFINGKAFKPTDWSEQGIPIIRIQNLNGLDKPFNYWAGPLDKEVNVKRNDLLLAWSGTPGTSFGAHIWRGGAAVLNQHIFRVDLKENLVTKEWAKFVINAQLNTLIGMAHGGVGLQHVTKGMVEGLEIPVPPLPEQRRIAAILDQADALRAKRREALAQLDSLTQSIFIDMFGDPVVNSKQWPRVAFATLLENIDSGWSPVCLDRTAQGGEWGVLKLGAVTSCTYKDSENKALPEGVAFDSKIEVKSGDLLFSRKNTYNLVAACVLVDETRERLMLSDLLFRFRLKSEAQVEKRYLQSLLTFPTKRSEVQKLAGGSSGSMPNISKGRLLELAIELPPLNLQQIYDSRIQSIQALRNTHHAALRELNVLFASLQYRAFRGEL